MRKPGRHQESSAIDEARIDADIELIERLAHLPWQRDLRNVEALIERLRMEMMIGDFRGSRKHLYRAIIDRFEDVLEDRYEKEGDDREAARRTVMSYVRSLWQSIDK